MLGDSVRRRNPGQQPPRSPRRPSSGDRPHRLRWKVWAPVLVTAAVLPFLIGYVLATWILFPAPEVSGSGIPVPALRGMSQIEARQAIEAAGFGTLDGRMLPHPDAPEGTVIAQAPLPGQQLRAGATVRVAISSGVPRIVLPDVVGFQAERARVFLQRLGVQVEEEEEESAAERGRVLRSEPQAGERVALPATVRLTISAGMPEPADSLTLPADTLPIRPDTAGTPGAPAR